MIITAEKTVFKIKDYLLKSILQIKIVFSIIKNTTFLNKLLILAESIINIFWYSIVLTFKLKK